VGSETTVELPGGFGVVAIRFWLGNGRKSAKSGDFNSSAVFMFTGDGIFVAPAGTSTICPALTNTDSRGYLISAARAPPSKTFKIVRPAFLDSKMTVVPVMATETALVAICAPPAFFGT
jgi:hypothetical protein